MKQKTSFMKNKEKGITLIALIITIIVLLILAGVTINTLTGQNGLLNRAKNAGEKTKYASAFEIVNLKIMEANTKMMADENRFCSLYELAKYMSSDKETDILVKTYNPVAMNDSGNVIPSENELIGFSVQSKEYEKYTFLIGTTCSIEKVSIDGGTTFVKIEEFAENQITNSADNIDTLKWSYTVTDIIENNAQILIKAQDGENGIYKVELPNGESNQYDSSKDEQTISCSINMNTENKFIIINSKGKITEKIINVETLKEPTTQYDKTANINSVQLKIEYPENAIKKEYQIGTDGEWREYSNEITIIENSIINYRYTVEDGRTSQLYSINITNIGTDILKYTNVGEYLYGSNDNEKIQGIKNMFNTNFKSATFTNTIYFTKWFDDVAYFQDNKIEAIEATKLQIQTYECIRGYEPVKDFYITASNTIDFQNEVEIYRGEHTPTVTNFEFNSKGKYQFYRLYVTSWWPYNKYDGQTIFGCYIE